MASMAEHVRAMLAFQRAGAVTFDYGNNIRAQAAGRRRGQRLRLPRLRARLHPAALLRGQGAVPLGRALGRPGRHPAHRRGDPGAVPGGRVAARAGSAWPRQRVPFQGLPARICWLGYGERARAGLAFNELVATGEVSAPDRHRPRPPRLRLGGLAQPRDRGDARRLRRDRRLAAPQRAGQHRRRRDLGRDPPRRRDGDRLLAARRHGGRRRRHGAGGAEAGARADHRPGHGRHPPRRRGYERAIEVARERGVRVPMLEGE